MQKFLREFFGTNSFEMNFRIDELMKMRAFLPFPNFWKRLLFLKIIQIFYCERTKKKNKKH